MTVQELIDLLSKLPPDYRVMIARSGEPMCDKDFDPNEPVVSKYWDRAVEL